MNDMVNKIQCDVNIWKQLSTLQRDINSKIFDNVDDIVLNEIFVIKVDIMDMFERPISHVIRPNSIQADHLLADVFTLIINHISEENQDIYD